MSSDSDNDSDNDNNIVRYLPLYRAILTDDWETVEAIFKQDSDADTAIITSWGATALHIAVGTNSPKSHRFVDKLVNRISDNDKSKLRTPDYDTDNALHYAAKVGNINATKALVEKDVEMTLIENPGRNAQAVIMAACYGHRELLVYLLGVTPDRTGEDGMMSPYSGSAGGCLITFTITAGFYDVAIKLINEYPNLVMEENEDGITALRKLATQPRAFPSGRSRWFWHYIIYNRTPLNSTLLTDDVVNLKSEKKPSKLWRKTPSRGKGFFKSILFPAAWFKYVSFGLNIMIWRVAQYLVPLLKNIHDTKLKDKQTDQLMNVIITAILNVRKHSVSWDVLGTAMSTAAEHGIYEIIEECLARYPCLVWYRTEELSLFSVAIKYRQVKVYNLLYQMTKLVGVSTGEAADKISQDNALHLVGRKPSQHILNTVTGAALQMQRELQWFKEVKKIVVPYYREALNMERKTPLMVFIDEHTDLVEKGEKWMKDTASSSTLVAALIVTVSFAAIFTVPGGNKDNGTAYFLRDPTFILFVISDVVALFSAITSVLMFLAMLTSRYAMDDFLHALPKRITFGLVSLFISIASIMVTFCAAIVLVLREQFAWIALPVGLIACVPVIFFALLQFPLLVELVYSTYGPSIFHKQNNRKLH